MDSFSLFESGLVKYLLTFSMLKIESLFDIKNIMVSVPCVALCILSIKVEIGYATYSSELDSTYTCFSYNLKITSTYMYLEMILQKSL